MRIMLMSLGLAALGACDVQPLRHQDLFGVAQVNDRQDAATDVDPSTPDTAPADGPIADAPRDTTGPTPDAAGPDTAANVCMSAARTGILSGLVVDKCTGQQVNALVGIFGKHQCSFAGKGTYCFSALPTGCELTLGSAKDGFKPYSKAIKIDPGGSANVTIELERASGDCAGPLPTGSSVCACELPTCTQGCN